MKSLVLATRGIQCSCISLYGICFSVFKSVSRWNINDLEYIVEKGDLLYKMQNTTQFLCCPELPRSVMVESVCLNINFCISQFGFLHNGSNSITDLVNSLTSCRESYDGVIFVVNGYCFSILFSGQHVYVTDSHSRDSEGRPFSQGTAVVLKFSSFF